MWKILLQQSFSFIICCFLATSSLFGVVKAYMMVSHARDPYLTTCPKAADPTPGSWLIVLLDRSGSLKTTDPHRYSTSSAKILADIWPGSMIVIFVSGSDSPLHVLGPTALANPLERIILKNAIEHYPIEGGTPLDAAMKQTLQKLYRAPLGSRVVLITDGSPTGSGDNDQVHQEQDIRNNLLRQFCKMGVPVTPVGLTISPNTQEGQDANQLLKDIANSTGGIYTNVRRPEELAHAVVDIYAHQWRHLSFIDSRKTLFGDYPVSIDPFVKQVSILIFRSDTRYEITLLTPGNHSLTQGIEQSIDRHYEIVNFDTSVPLVGGTYEVYIDNDPDGQVDSLILSPIRRIQLLTPTADTEACTNSTLPITAAWFNDQTLLTPSASQHEAQLVAHVKLLINVQPDTHYDNTIVLSQQGAYFNGQTETYDQTGELVIDVSGTLKQAGMDVERQASITIPLKPLSLSCLPCQPQNIRCLLLYYLPPAILLFFLIAFMVTSQRRTI